MLAKTRAEFGKQCIFDVRESQMDATVLPRPADMNDYIRRSHCHVGIQHTKQLALHEVSSVLSRRLRRWSECIQPACLLAPCTLHLYIRIHAGLNRRRDLPPPLLPISIRGFPFSPIPLGCDADAARSATTISLVPTLLRDS